MIAYNSPLFRPPAEANSIILQVTLGCSYNRCSFCSMYKSKKYIERNLDDIYKDIDDLANYHHDATKVFLADGDAFALSTDQLLNILNYLKKKFPKLRRVSSYASTQNIYKKTDEELKTLKENGLTLIYFGIESGNNEVLKKITKSVKSSEIINALNRFSNANIKISATVILGIGGTKYSQLHVKDTAQIVNATTINYLSTLQLWLEDDAKDNFYKKFSDFIELSNYEMIQEQYEFVKLLNPKNRVIFRSNHVSNILPLAGTLSKDKERLLEEIYCNFPAK